MKKSRIITNFLAQTHYDISWHSILEQALNTVDTNYLQVLLKNTDWLPGISNIFNAFNLPLERVNYILLGESPYPRVESANGYAFWDQAVDQLWSKTGLSKSVNRATSLRNFIKMLLVAANKLMPEQTTAEKIAEIDKKFLIQTNQELFKKLLGHGFLLLNASLTLATPSARLSAQQWLPFLHIIFTALHKKSTPPTLILLGNIAKCSVDKMGIISFPKMIAEHPYNLSFISQPDVIKLFKPLNLLEKDTGAI